MSNLSAWVMTLLFVAAVLSYACAVYGSLMFEKDVEHQLRIIVSYLAATASAALCVALSVLTPR